MRGFTLVELLVALALLAVLAVLSLRGLTSILESESHVRAETQRWSTLAMVTSQIGHDLSLATERPRFAPGGELVIARRGDADVASAQSGPHEVAYRLRGGALEYRVRAAASPVLANVAAFELREVGTPPRALEAEIVLTGGERVTRIFLLP